MTSDPLIYCHNLSARMNSFCDLNVGSSFQLHKWSAYSPSIWGGFEVETGKAFFAASLAAHPISGDHNLGGGEWGQGRPCPSFPILTQCEGEIDFLSPIQLAGLGFRWGWRWEGGMHKNRHGNYSRISLCCSSDLEKNKPGERGRLPPSEVTNS